MSGAWAGNDCTTGSVGSVAATVDGVACDSRLLTWSTIWTARISRFNVDVGMASFRDPLIIRSVAGVALAEVHGVRRQLPACWLGGSINFR